MVRGESDEGSAGMGCEALLRAQVDRRPDFPHLANVLSALYPKQSEETVARQDAFSGSEMASLNLAIGIFGYGSLPSETGDDIGTHVIERTRTLKGRCRS